MPPGYEVVFLFDVDDTLFDNDRLKRDLEKKVLDDYGAAAAERFWAIYEEQRAKHGYADPIGTLERFRLEHLHHDRIITLATWLMEYPFSEGLFPDALAVVRHVRQWGLPVILTDGDGVFQPWKLERSGLLKAFDGHALDYIHKEKELDAIGQAYPAARYVCVDDKLSVLDAIKKSWGDRVTTIFVKQGHYALDAGTNAGYAAADLTVDRIAELMMHEFSALAPV
jgi:hypothetical protein